MIAFALAAAVSLSDSAVEQRKSDLDAAYRVVESEVDREFSESVAFHTRLKNERLDFERRLLADRKNMLDSLKGRDAGGRQAVYDAFHVSEARRREDFRSHEAALKQAFRRQFLEERHGAQRALRRRREDLQQQHRR